MYEPDIWEGSRIEDSLRKVMSHGARFFSIQQTSRIVGVSSFRIYYMVYHYRLDAFLVDGQYRIPWNAISALAEDYRAIVDTYTYCDLLMQEMAVPHALEARRLALAGRRGDALELLGNAQGLLDDLLAWKPSLGKGSGGEPVLMDWYDIPHMGLPDIAPGYQWARLIGTDPFILGVKAGDDVPYIDMYDWLVDHEVINLPCGYTVVPVDRNAGQLSLF
ncbi:MAG: hypothetical protein SPF89_11080 [Sphaerochaetaceae bacterium]|nr:hypothetical protein [Spirochaetales bacterium]MDY5500638.1 hypothetical protein [Sphaerochaetaceae bacterium]